jgi:hypothetical protein
MQTTNDAVNFFIERCSPLNDLVAANVEAVPPGMFRNAVVDEWTAFIEKTRAR